ncbi:MAG: bifunctional folylpolyglutamate synthase/dihydrofolate synthase [Acidobacteria bacterium]|nr:bifunctional folylpolyglutamate synthase/dihydrofolate synthase [Acidobacteriota bacterium]
MNYQESVEYLYSLGHETLAMKLGLVSVHALADACGDPQMKFPAVHIAGTNGKGSTAAMTESILRSAGYRTGLYTSPHLISITERIKVDGNEIGKDDFARLVTLVREAGERLVEDGLLEALPTFFEQITMVAFLYFAECQVELAVLEVGLGGRLDATNICQPLVTAITPISFDHQQYLGGTLKEIAGEKAGIIKTGVPVIVAPQEEAAIKAIASRAAERRAPLIDGRLQASLVDRYDVHLNLRGRHQVTNASTAIRIIDLLKEMGWGIADSEIKYGLEKVQWPGRLELVRPFESAASLLLDGAHNPAGVNVLRDYLTENFDATPITLIFGVMSDKAIEEMLGILFPVARTLIVTRVINHRAAEPEVIAEVAAKFNWEILQSENASHALAEAFRVTPKDGLICVCGSLFLVGEIKERLQLNI